MASNWYLAPLFHVTLALLLVSSTVACSCVNPPFLSECDVGDGEAALLVSVICQKTMQCGSFSASGISDVTIDLVLKDETDLGLQIGDTVSIESSLDGSRCGFSLEASTTYIVFVQQTISTMASGATTPTAAPADSINTPSNGTTANRARRRLSSFTVPGGCDWFEAPLTTTLCSGNIRQPTEGQVRELADGCLNPLQD